MKRTSSSFLRGLSSPEYLLLFIVKGGVFNLTSESFDVKFNGKCF